MRRLRMRGLTLFLVLAATGSCGVSTGGSGGDPVDRGGGIMARPDLGCPLGEVPRGGACAPNLPSCATTGGCLPDQPYCDDVGHFAVTPDIVVDRETGRLWQRRHAPTMLTYAEAEAVCDDLALGGITRWRIPTIEELHSIVLEPGELMGCAPGYCCPSIDQSAFPDTPANLFWSSTAPFPDLVYCLQFSDGRYSTWKTELTAREYLRCTHDPLP